MPTEFIELAGEVNQQMPYFCVERIERALNDHAKPVRGSRIAIARRLLQGRRRRPARVARAEDHAAARASSAPSSPTTTRTSPELPELGLSSRAARRRPRRCDLAVIVTAHPGVDLDAIVASAPLVVDFRGVTRGIEAAEPRAAVSDGPITRRRRRARLLGPEPGAQLRPRCRRRELRWMLRRVGGGARALAPGRSRDARVTADLDELLADPDLDAVVVATPVPTHADARGAGAARPASTASSRSRWRSRSPRPSRPSRRRATTGRVLMVGHLLEYHPGVETLKEIADSGELGDIHYIYGNRLNLGQLRADENALWIARRARRLGRAARSRRRGAGRAERARRVLHAGRGSRTSSSPSCASRRGSPPTCTCRGSTRTRSGASPSSARSRWRRSTTWSSSAS